MTSSAIWASFTYHLKASNIYNGESVHSTRRGSMIEASQNDVSIEQVQAMIRSKPIAMECVDTIQYRAGPDCADV